MSESEKASQGQCVFLGFVLGIVVFAVGTIAVPHFYKKAEKQVIPVTAERARQLNEEADKRFVDDALESIEHLAEQGHREWSKFIDSKEVAQKHAKAFQDKGFEVFVKQWGDDDNPFGQIQIVIRW